MYYQENLHERLTKLLMEAGASANKTSVDRLIEFIARRDTAIIDQVQSDLRSTRTQLVAETDAFLPLKEANDE